MSQVRLKEIWQILLARLAGSSSPLALDLEPAGTRERTLLRACARRRNLCLCSRRQRVVRRRGCPVPKRRTPPTELGDSARRTRRKVKVSDATRADARLSALRRLKRFGWLGQLLDLGAAEAAVYSVRVRSDRCRTIIPLLLQRRAKSCCRFRPSRPDRICINHNAVRHIFGSVTRSSFSKSPFNPVTISSRKEQKINKKKCLAGR